MRAFSEKSHGRIYELPRMELMLETATCTSVQFIVFQKQMLQGANNDLFNPPIGHNSECQNLSFPLQN